MFFKKHKQASEKTDDTSKKVIDPDTYAKLLNRISERDAEISAFKAKLSSIELIVEDLRGKMSKKLRDLQKEHKEDLNEKDLNSNYIPFG